MKSNANSVADYLASLPDERRAAISAVRDVILKNLDSEYAEGPQYGMIGYFVPHSVYPAGYQCDPKQPLPFAALGSQKNYMALHLMCLYTGGEESGPAAAQLNWFREAWARSGKKLDMGKACIRFKRVEDLALDVIGEVIRRVPARAYIAAIEASLARRHERRAEPNKPAKTASKASGRTAKATTAAAKKGLARAAKSSG